MIQSKKLKHGIKVKILHAHKDTFWYANKVGSEYIVDDYDPTNHWYKVKDTTHYLFAEDIIILEEKQMFDMKTQPWKIYVNNEEEYNATNKWLGINFGNSLDIPYRDYIIHLTNTDDMGSENKYVMWSSNEDGINRHEIKLTFKTETTVDSIQYPTVESDKQRKIRELKETIEKAQQQIEELGE